MCRCSPKHRTHDDEGALGSRSEPRIQRIQGNQPRISVRAISLQGAGGQPDGMQTRSNVTRFVCEGRTKPTKIRTDLLRITHRSSLRPARLQRARRSHEKDRSAQLCSRRIAHILKIGTLSTRFRWCCVRRMRGISSHRCTSKAAAVGA